MEEKNCAVGVLVQNYGEGNSVKDGEIVAVLPAKKSRPKDYYNYSATDQKDFEMFITVKYDDGSLETISPYEVDLRDSKLEREFRDAAALAAIQINAKLLEASKALREAERLSEEFGIPFDSSLSPLSQGFTPKSFYSKYNDVSKDVMNNVTGVYNDYPEQYGWQHSQAGC